MEFAIVNDWDLGLDTPIGRNHLPVAAHGEVFVVGIGGTTRPGSSSERALKRALDATEELGARTQLFAAGELDLPMYAPERPERTESAVALVEALARADGIIVASPGYHGGISGLIKNALDYVEDLRGDPRPYFDGRAVGCIACAAGWQAAVTTLSSLRLVVHALRGWPTPLGVAINSIETGPQGSDVDPGPDPLAIIGQQVVEFALRQAGTLAARLGT